MPWALRSRFMFIKNHPFFVRYIAKAAGTSSGGFYDSILTMARQGRATAKALPFWLSTKLSSSPSVMVTEPSSHTNTASKSRC